VFSAVSIELSRHDWGSLATDHGTAAEVPAAVTALVAATTAEEAAQLSGNLDNVVIVQSNLYEAAVPLVSVLCAALTDDLPAAARSRVLWLICHTVNGETHYSEIEAGRPDLEIRAREVARAGLWLFYRELLHGDPADTEDVVDILDVVETDRVRFERFRDLVKDRLRDF
jgi:hypothetical protein